MSSHPQLTASCLSQRLVAAVEEVMELVRATVIQYEQESAQVRRENQLLRSKLVQITGGLPPETAAESSPTGDEWADWTRHMDQNSGTTADPQNQQNIGCDDPDPAYEDQNPTQGCADLAAGQCELVPAVKSDGLSLSPEPGLVPLGPPIELPTEPPTSCIGVKTEWTDHATEPNDQSEQRGSSDVKAEHLHPMRTIKTEPQDTELFSELHLDVVESTHAHPGLDLESAAMETVTFVERHLEPRELAPPNAPPPTTNTSHHHSQPITAQLQPPHATDTRPPQLSDHPPRAAALSLCSSQQLAGAGAAPFTHNPSARPRPLLTAQGRDSALLPQRHHGNPVVSPSPASGRGRARGRCAVSFPCQQCGKLFVHRSRLRVHMLIHTGEKPYACQRCGKRFNNDGTLKNHQRVHTQLRLYSCPLCAMRFKDAYTCRKHLATHTRRAHAQANTHTTQDTHTRRPQAQANTHTTLPAQAQVHMLSSHNTPNTSNTHRDQRLPVSHVRPHTHAVAPQTHTHSHTLTHTHTHIPSSAMWMGRSTETERKGQR